MPAPLRSEILAVTGNPTLRTILVAVGCTTLGAIVGGLYVPPAVSQVRIVPVVGPHVVEKIVEKTVTIEAPPRPARASEIQFVVSADSQSYMKLATIDAEHEIMPKHGKAKLFSRDGVETVVASVDPADVPSSYRVWLQRAVLVDGNCYTKVTGFAVIARLTGSPGYAEDDTSERWTAKSVLANGSTMLAAKLGGCTGMLARDATLPPIVTPEPIDENELASPLAAQAKATLLASAAAKETQKEWIEAERTGQWSDRAFVDVQVLRHPITHMTWVAVHMWHDMGCGEPSANVWGLFHVTDDGSLVATQLRRMDDMTGIEQLIDIEGDGELEILGRPWLGVEQRITRASGEELDQLALPFFGCPC